MKLECQDCGYVYSTDRDPDTPQATTTRCRSCGEQNDPETAAVDEATDGSGGRDTLEITLTIQVHAPDGVQLDVVADADAEVTRDA